MCLEVKPKGPTYSLFEDVGCNTPTLSLLDPMKLQNNGPKPSLKDHHFTYWLGPGVVSGTRVLKLVAYPLVTNTRQTFINIPYMSIETKCSIRGLGVFNVAGKRFGSMWGLSERPSRASTSSQEKLADVQGQGGLGLGFDPKVPKVRIPGPFRGDIGEE